MSSIMGMEAGIMNGIFGNTMYLTERSLDYLWQRQQVTMNNIANNDTPGFKAKFVTFEDSLRQRLNQVAGRHGTFSERRDGIGSARIIVHGTGEKSSRLDGNNVQVDVESVELVRAQLQYQAQVQSFNSDVNRLRTVIKGQ